MPLPVPRSGFHGSSPVTSTVRSEEHTSELQSQSNLGCRLLPEKKLVDHEARYVRSTGMLRSKRSARIIADSTATDPSVGIQCDNPIEVPSNLQRRAFVSDRVSI